MLSFLRFIKGYLCLSISGYSPERFMNLCRTNGIMLWNIVPGEGFYECKILYSDYPRIDIFLKKTKVKAEIRKKCGLPFFMYKNKKRMIFFLGIWIAIAFIYGMSFFIWSFRFSGNHSISDDILLRFVNTLGVHYGTYKKEIDIPMLEEEIRKYFNNISWISVRISGTSLEISMKENEIAENINNGQKKEYDDILCTTEGEIVQIITRSGVPLVKVGDTVTVGSVLVEGKVPIFDNDGNVISYDYVDADADITIRTKYPIHRTLSRYYRHKNYTGNEYRIPYIRLGQNYFCIHYPKNSFELYDVVVAENTHPLFSEFSIPLYWGSRKYCEYVEIEDLYNDEEGNILLNQFLEQTIKELNEKGVQIIENNVKIESNSQYLKLTGDLLIDVTQKDT